MAVLSKRSVRHGPSSGHDFDRINEKLYGSGRSKLNKRKDLFGSDYIYVYKESSDDDDDAMADDSEIGINKNYHRIHDMDWCNCEKNEHHAMNRFFDAQDNNDISSDIEFGDVEIDLKGIEDFLFGIGDDDE